jgi:hypothetical protein
MNKIMIDGKEYELSAELVEKIKAEVAEQERQDKKNLFERKRGSQYYYTTSSWSVCEDVDTSTMTDDGRYQAANYCCDRGLMKQRALHEMLNRLLWRYSETHGGENAWDSQNIQAHYYIYLDTKNSVLYVSYNDVYHVEGVVYFKEEYIAENAITEVVKPFMAAHPEFVW